MKRVFFCIIAVLFAMNIFAQESIIEHLTKETFLQKVMNYELNPQTWVYEGNLPCIVDFYASWCGPCRRLAPILEELAAEYEGKIVIYKVNTQEQPELAYVFGASSIPMLWFCPMNDNPQIARGLQPKETLIEIINNVLLK